MSKFLIKRKLLNEDGSPTFYGYYFLWSDGFLRSFIRQKLNGVWVLTITFTDFENNSTSPFHTRCLAIRKGHLSHSPVMDWYAKEIAALMEGYNYYCGIRGFFIKVKVVLIAYLADRPEKASALNTSLLGTYGKGSN